jgi:glutaredoxin
MHAGACAPKHASYFTLNTLGERDAFFKVLPIGPDMTTAHAIKNRSAQRCARVWTVTGLVLVLGLAAVSASAQGVYRIVGPDGRVTFSDQPLSTADARAVGSTGASSVPDSAAQLPFQLRQVVARYPVTLYTAKECAPCNSGRNLLNARGIPYIEKLINTPEDGNALKRLSGEASLPFLTIGGQQIKGYSDTEWTQFLDAAGYPKTSALPGNYRRPAPAPLVAAKPVAAPPAAGAPPISSAAPPRPVEVPVAPPVSNPAGIRF